MGTNPYSLMLSFLAFISCLGGHQGNGSHVGVLGYLWELRFFFCGNLTNNRTMTVNHVIH